MRDHSSLHSGDELFLASLEKHAGEPVYILTAASHLNIPIGYVETGPWQQVALLHPSHAAKVFISSMKNLGIQEEQVKELERHVKASFAPPSFSSSKYAMSGGE